MFQLTAVENIFFLEIIAELLTAAENILNLIVD